MPESEELPYYRKIKAMSDYMMFLVAERPEMLPGLRLHSNYENIRVALTSIWKDGNSNLSSYKQEEKKLARDLFSWNAYDLHERNTILSEAIQYAKVLQLLCVPMNSSETSTDWSGIRTEVPMEDETEKRLLFLVPDLLKFVLWEDRPLGKKTPENVLHDFIL